MSTTKRIWLWVVLQPVLTFLAGNMTSRHWLTLAPCSGQNHRMTSQENTTPQRGSRPRAMLSRRYVL